MKAILTIILFMAFAAVLGTQKWRSRTMKYVIIGILALVQTIMVLIDMFTMKVPKL